MNRLTHLCPGCEKATTITVFGSVAVDEGVGTVGRENYCSFTGRISNIIARKSSYDKISLREVDGSWHKEQKQKTSCFKCEETIERGKESKGSRFRLGGKEIRSELALVCLATSLNRFKLLRFQLCNC